MTDSSLFWKRAVTEFCVIVIGVMVALTADRWLTGRDARADASAYIARLADTLRADYVSLDLQQALAERRASRVVQLLGLIEGAEILDTLDAAALLRDFEMIAWFSPLDYSRETWDDLVATGALRLHASLGHVRLVWLAYAFVCEDLLRHTSELLRQIESAA